MKYAILAAVMGLAGCQTVPAGLVGPVAVDARAAGSAFQEFLVIGSSMSFEQCRARGGLIIRDRGSPMVACDPSVTGEPVPADEFDHPESRAVAAAQSGSSG